MPDTVFTYSDGTTSTSSNTTLSSSSRVAGKALTSVSIGDTVTSISTNTFSSTGLTTVVIPNNVTNLGDYVFSSCLNLTSISIGSGVNSIGSLIFSGCPALTNFTVDSNNLTFASQNNVLYNKALTTILQVPVSIAGTFTIPNSVATISSFAFYNSSITQVVIPNSVTSILSDAFNSSKLTSVTIPSSVVNFGDWVFLACNELTNATVNASRIGYSVFRLCSKLSNVTINGSPPRFEGFAFGSCSQLRNINIPSSVTELREYAFYQCSNLTKITIPNNVSLIKEGCFELCPNLTRVNFLGNAPSFNSPPSVFNASLNVKLYRKKNFVTGWSDNVQGIPVVLWSDNKIRSNGIGKFIARNSIIFNNTFNTAINTSNTNWRTNNSASIITAPVGCPNPKCLYISQGFKTNLNPDPTFSASSLYSVKGFGEIGMIDLAKSYTIEFWFYVTNISNIYNGGQATFYFIRGCGGDPIQGRMNLDRSITWFVQNFQGDPNIFTLTTAPSLWNLNSWNHLALVNNRILGNRTIFLNGINVASGSGNKSWNGDGSNLYGTPTANYQWGIGHDFDNGYNVYISNMRWMQKPMYISNFTSLFLNYSGSQN